MPIHRFPQLTDAEPSVSFNAEDVPFQIDDEVVIGEWLKKIIEQEEKELHLLNFIFCSDHFLHQLNVQYLDHDTLTDVITFHYAEPPFIEGDIYISLDRVKENAEKFGATFTTELHRVMAHGVLHLCGYGDKTPEEAKTMRQKEDEALELLVQ